MGLSLLAPACKIAITPRYPRAMTLDDSDIPHFPFSIGWGREKEPCNSPAYRQVCSGQ